MPLNRILTLFFNFELVAALCLILFVPNIAYSAAKELLREYSTHGYDWEHNEIGMGMDVPTGFSAVVYQNNIVYVAGRQYQIQNSLLPTSIRSNNVELLNSPIELELVTDQGNFNTGDVATVVNKMGKSEVLLNSVVVDKGIQVRCAIEVGVDGFMKVDITVSSDHRIVIHNMAIKIELNSAHAREYNKYLAYDYIRQRINKSEMQGANGSIQGEMSFKFNPVIWIGNDSIGLEVLAETNAYHRLNNPEKAHVIRPVGGAVQLINRMIEKPFPLTKPMTVSMGLLATPVVKVSSGLRTKMLSSKSRKTKGSKLFESIHIGHWRRDGMPFPGIPVPAKAGTIGNIKYFRKRNLLNKLDIKYVPYAALHIMPTTLPELKHYRSVWSSAPARGGSALWGQKLGSSKPIQPISLVSKSVQDYIIHTHMQELTKRHLGGIYFDVAAPSSLSHVTERFAKEHKIENTNDFVFYPIFSHREFLLRYWRAMKHENGNFSIIHHGIQFPHYSLAFVDYAVFGESIHTLFERDRAVLESTENGKRKYTNPEEYVPDYYSLPSYAIPGVRSSEDGVAHVLLPQVRRFNDEYLSTHKNNFIKWTRSVIATWLLNDFRLWDVRIHYPTLESVIVGLTEFPEFGSADYSRLSLHSNNKLSGAVYSGKDSTLLIYSNTSDTVAETVLSEVNLNGGNRTIESVRIIKSGVNILRSSEGFELAVPAKDFVLLLVSWQRGVK